MSIIKLAEFTTSQLLILDSLETKANFLLFNQQFVIIAINYDRQHYGKESVIDYSDDILTLREESLKGKVVAIDDLSVLLFSGKSIPEILVFLSDLKKLVKQLIIVSHWDTFDSDLDQLNAFIGHDSFVIKLKKMTSGHSSHVDGEFLVYDEQEYHEYLYKVTEKGGLLKHK